MFTFVNHYFRMLKRESEIKKMLGRQVRRFASKELCLTPQKLANKMKEDSPEKEITRQYINAQYKSPSWIFILWLEKRAHLNIEWLLHGEENNDIRMLKL